MTTVSAFSRRQMLLVAGLAAMVVAVVLGALSTASPATSMSIKCSAGESEDLFTGVCLPELSPSVVQISTPDFGEAPEIDNVPCTGHNSYECIGLAEENLGQGPTPNATSELTAQTDVSTSGGEPTTSATSPPTGQDLTLSQNPPPLPAAIP